MSKIYKSIDELIGNTPLLELTRIEKEFNLKARVLAKLEAFNPTGSVKDRAAVKMLDEAEKNGLVKPGAVIIEPTSGNTGIGLASIGTTRGYKVIIVMPDTMSIERIKLIKAFGAEVVLTDGTKGMTGAIEKAEQLNREIPNSFIAGQFVNPANVNAHIETTGPEIFRDTDGNIDCFVACVGTGGTLTGIGKYLKSKKSSIKIVAVEPEASPVLSKGLSGKHGIQGIGAGFIPEILDTSIYDEVITVTDEDAFSAGRLFGKKEGIIVGISSGAALSAAIKIAQRPEYVGKTVVVLLPDTGSRYLSTEMFDD